MNAPRPHQLQEIRIAQVHLLIGHLPSILFGTAVVAGLLVLVVDSHVASSWPWFWLLGVLLLCAVRWYHRSWMLRVPTDLDNVGSRQRQLLGLSFASGALLGLFGAASMDPDAVTASLTVGVALAGMVAAASGVISHVPSMYPLYVLPLLLPMIARFVWIDMPGYRAVGVLAALYTGVCLLTSRTNGRAVLDGMRLRFENLDLVESLRAEKRLSDEARERAEQANSAKSVFLSSASHDLRQPLHSLRLFSATLESRLAGLPDLEARRLIGKIDESGRALEGLFDAILDLSRLDAGTLQPRPVTTDLGAFLHRLCLAYEPLAQARGLRFELSIPDEAPRAVMTDPGLLEQLIGNLLGNAVRYTARGAVGLTVREAGSRVFIEVHDTGPGIAFEDQERIFEEFVQLGNPERDRSQGIGLGLSVVRRLAKMLDVRLALDSEPGSGTRFSLSVPVGEECQLAPADDVQNFSVEPSLEGRLVLIVDDEASVRDALEGLVDTWGAVTLGAGSGKEALELLSEIEARPDVIVSDWRLRDNETGADVIDAVRRGSGSDVPAIIITGDVAPDKLRKIDLTGWPVLHKPCSPPELRSLLVAAVERVSRDASHDR